MTAPAFSLEDHAAGLLAALDEEIGLLEARRGQLEALSVAIVQRDERRMETLLAEGAATLESQAGVDRRLRQARAALAGELGCPAEEVRLAPLAERLPPGQRVNVEFRRRRIVELVARLRRQHQQTAVLLAECARVNRLLLEALLPGSKAVETYGSKGPQRWRPETPSVWAER